MKGDFSRLTFDPAKHFSRVLMQQGRVQLDADWNEQSSLLLHHQRMLARAIIGPHGGTPRAFVVGKGTGDRLFDIGAGVYFVEGIMCDNTDGKVAFTPPDTWTTKDDKSAERPAGDYLVYLLVTERHVTFVNDEEIRERALGDGVDTATRTKVVCTVSARRWERLGGLQGAARDAAVREALESVLPGGKRPTMSASTEEVNTRPQDICNVPPFAEYRGENNQLYRVEIHEPPTNDRGATFKWSRENGSVVFPVSEVLDGGRVVVERYGREGRSALRKGDWVEFEDDDLIAAPGKPYELARVRSVEGNVVTLSIEPPRPKTPGAKKFGMDQSKHPLLRRWDYATHPEGATYFSKGLITIEGDDKTYKLEQGIRVTFRANGGVYRRGDYWVIPARTAGGRIDWPKGVFLEARRAEGGIAPLAVINVTDNKINENVLVDLRKEIKPIAGPPGA